MRKGRAVLILGLQRLVVLETPKTGSLALRAMLAPYTLPVSDDAPRHTGYFAYLAKQAPKLSQAFGGALETVAVVRAPLGRMRSWYRYRMRGKVAHLKVSTRGISFEEFMVAYLDGSNPEMANVGRQDRFVGWNGRAAGVDHVFDYDQLDLLETFLSERVGTDLALPLRNTSPQGQSIDYSLSDAVMARYRHENAEEFALYKAVSEAGQLIRSGVAKPVKS
ncbi:hypothetical protein [Pseudorhodobacter ferrugineus]|uniref:hypothetical protein n=1 Tax=Pseudorhodobacter ferrugineus TaxID=77008 RepID=UPI0003B69AE2|nr:hypothetical protein [Pseudorhodobacter ferrugineus]